MLNTNLISTASYRSLLDQLTRQNQVDAAAYLEELPITQTVLLIPNAAQRTGSRALFSSFP